MTNPNIEAWTRKNAEHTDARAEQAWQDEINWGVWHVPESELNALPDVAGKDVVELGCGTAYFGSWLPRPGGAPDVHEDDEPVSVFHAKEMAWCASFQLSSFGDCRERFEHGVLPRCALCPLFDSERAIRAGIREDPAPGQRFQIVFGQDDFGLGPEPDFTKITDLDFLYPDVLALLGGEIPDWMDLSGLVPDRPPMEWGGRADEDDPAG